MSTGYDLFPRQAPPRQRGAFVPVLAVILVSALLGVLLVRHLGLFNKPGDGTDPDAKPREVTPRGDLWPEETRIVDLYARARKSAVAVYTFDARKRGIGSGSGFIWDKEGRVVTNAHVVSGGSYFEVTLSDQTTAHANLIASYPPKDTAVLILRGVDKSKLEPIPLGRSDELKVGQYTFAIGGPYGLEQTLTRGIISAVGREIPLESSSAIKNVIQTDAAINPGNSGGPLLDSSGRLIGMNTAILSKSGASAGIGFAIPVDEINQVVPQLIQHKRVLRPVLGATFYPESESRAAGLDGLAVAAVAEDTPAARAGLRPWSARRRGDLVIAADGKPVHRLRDLAAILDGKKPGDTLKLTIIRDDEEMELDVKLDDEE